MILEELQVRGFGRHENLILGLGPGLNLILGPNESGKSTILEAIVALLYGFHEHSRARAAENKALDRWRPWDRVVPYGGRLKLRLRGGSRYRLDRDFQGLATVLINEETGQDESATFGQDRHGIVRFADSVLGMSRGVFRATALIAQGGLEDVLSEAEPVRNVLLELAESLSGDATADQAADSLEKLAKEKIGTDRASKRPLGVTRARLDGLREELRRILDKRSDMEETLTEVVELEASLASHVDRREVVRSQLDRLEWTRVQADLDQLSDVDARIKDIEDRVPEVECARGFDQNEYEAFRKAFERRGKLLSTIRTIREEISSDSEDSASSLTSKIAESRAAIQDNEAFAEFPVEREQDLTTVVDEYRRAKQTLAERRRQLREMDSLPAPDDVPVTAPTVPSEIASDLLSLFRTANSRLADAEAELGRLSRAGGDDQRDAEKAAELVSRVPPDLQARLRDRRARQTVLHARANRRRGFALGILGLALVAAASLYAAVGPLWALISFLGLLPLAGTLLWLGKRDRGAAVDLGRRLEIEMDNLGGVTFDDLENANLLLLSNRESQHGLESAVRAKKSAQSEFQDTLNRIRESLGDLAPEPLTEEGLARLRDVLRKQELSVERRQDAIEHEKHARAAVESAETELASCKELVYGILDEVGLPALEPEEAHAAFRVRKERRHAYERAKERFDDLELARSQRLQVDETLREHQERLTSREQDLRTRLERAALPAESIDQGSQQYENLGRQAAQATEFKDDLDELRERRRLILRGRSRQDLEEDLARHSIEDAPVADPDSEGTLQHELEDLDRHVQETERRLAQLNGRVEEALRDEREQAEVEDDISLAEEELERLEEGRAALLLASEVLRNVSGEMHREFTPVLEDRIRQDLPRVTRGRYTVPHVDPANLLVTVESGEADRSVDLEMLSYATRAQVLTLLRLAVAEFVGRTKDEPPPLLMDDPFVDSDAERLGEICNVLTETAARAQIIYVSHDPRLADMLPVGEGQPHRVHKLDDMPGAR